MNKIKEEISKIRNSRKIESRLPNLEKEISEVKSSIRTLVELHHKLLHIHLALVV